MTEDGTFIDVLKVAADPLVHQLNKRGDIGRKKSSKNVARHKLMSRRMGPAMAKEQDHL